jgi:hypothetical protein
MAAGDPPKRAQLDRGVSHAGPRVHDHQHVPDPRQLEDPPHLRAAVYDQKPFAGRLSLAVAGEERPHLRRIDELNPAQVDEHLFRTGRKSVAERLGKPVANTSPVENRRRIRW